MPTTRVYKPRILLAFDFDKTLATDSVAAIAEAMGLTRDEWSSRFEEPLGDRWDAILRRGQGLIDAGRATKRPLSTDLMAQAAECLSLYDGVLDMPAHLRAVAEAVHPDCALEFAVVSSGFAEVIRATALTDAFDEIYASTFHFAEKGPAGEHGEALCMKRIIPHAQKAMYIEAHAKGLDVDGPNGPEQAARAVDPADMRMPLDQVIYGGDGDSDLQAFGFVEDHGGFAVAVRGGGSFEPGDRQLPGQRVENVADPSYADGSELMTTLEHAVRACASRIAMRAMGVGK